MFGLDSFVQPKRQNDFFCDKSPCPLLLYKKEKSSDFLAKLQKRAFSLSEDELGGYSWICLQICKIDAMEPFIESAEK